MSKLSKVTKFLGMLIILIACVVYFLFETGVKSDSKVTGFNVLTAKVSIPEGTVMKNETDLQKYFTVRFVAAKDAVPGAIKVDTYSGDNPFEKMKDMIADSEQNINPEDLKELVNIKVTRNFYKNEQIMSSFLTRDLLEFKDSERFYAIPVDYVSSVGADINKGDYVDVWIYYTDDSSMKKGTSEKLIGSLKIVKIKDSNNVEIQENGKEIPKLVIVKLNEGQISLLNTKTHEGLLSLTKWGVSPYSVEQMNEVMKGADNDEQ